MRDILLINTMLFILTLFSTSCASKSMGDAHNKAHDEMHNEVENKDSHISVSTNQLLLDSIFANDNIHYKNSALYNSRIKGHVKSISLPFDENSLYFRLEEIEFNEDGSISTIKGDNESLERMSIEVDSIDCIISVEFDETMCMSFFEFDLSKNDKKSFNYNAEGFDLTYTFEYSPNGELKRIVKVQKEMHYEIEDAKPTEETEVFDVRIDKSDEKGNWTVLSLKSPKSSHFINRHIEYYDETTDTMPKLIETWHQEKILFEVTNQFGYQCLRMYDKNTGIVHRIVPPDYIDNEVYGYSDYKLVGENLYIIIPTGAAGALAYNCVYAVNKYNIESGEWEEISYCGDGCEIVGNRIKMPYYNPDTDKTEIEWLDMR